MNLLPDEPEYRQARDRPRLASFIVDHSAGEHVYALDVLDGHDVSALFMKHFKQWQEERKLDTRNPPYFSDTKTPEQRLGAEIMYVFKVFRNRIRDSQKEVRYPPWTGPLPCLSAHQGEARVWQDKPEQWIPFDAASGAALLDF